MGGGGGGKHKRRFHTQLSPETTPASLSELPHLSARGTDARMCCSTSGGSESRLGAACAACWRLGGIIAGDQRCP